MLRSWSTAALEHAQTRGSGDSDGSQDLSISEEEDEEDGEAASQTGLCFRIGLWIGYMLPTWGHLSLANVGRSWAAGAFALWHCYLFLAIAIVLFINCAAAVLRCYINWYAFLRHPYLSQFRVVTLFLGAFFRSFLLVSVTSDILRFAYLLCVDAWRADAFEAYRRMLVSDAWEELKAGSFYWQGWSPVLTRRQKAFDIIFQCIIYITLDIMPVVLFFAALSSDLLTHVRVCEVCLGIAMFHLFAFYFLWLCGEVTLKVRCFRRAWRSARAVDLQRGQSVIQNTVNANIWIPTQMQFENPDAERRSICVALCTIFHWVEYLFPALVGLITCVAGFLLNKQRMAEVGVLATILTLFVMAGTHKALDQMTDDEKCVPLCVKRFFRHPQVLQRWGEKWCRLNFYAQKRQRFPFAVTIVLSAAVFGAFGFLALTSLCMGLMLFMCLRLLWMRFEGNCGWLWGFLEFVAEFLLLNYIILATAHEPMRDALVIGVLCAMRQFGFQREISAGERVRLASMMILGLVHIFLMCLVCFALETVYQDQNWSAFGASMNTTTFYPIQSHPVRSYEMYPLCLSRFPAGRDELSVADFGLMASLTYEPPSRVGEGLRHYFPGWHVEKKPDSAGSMNWVRFVMFTTDDNSTTVIAVRGTLDSLDVLHDVTLWLVPAVMQRGPSKPAVNSDRIPLSTINQQQTFRSVLYAAKFMMKEYPNRLYYLAGHSLGGGVAKLVELELSQELRQTGPPPLTMAFAAPGVFHSAFVLFGDQPESFEGLESMKEEMATFTVMPHHDIVSKIDVQKGNILRAPCKGSALQCHSIYRTLWFMFKQCGSMTRKNLTVPCGWTAEAPCLDQP
ncbi:unnamed protein product [Effrenium voratum]|uniref:Fungal lipase-type domain-containing protein n=1 Tax=Effrenium voratum TaxID=2562239 RepID=A0AA36J259_9DINO|nr:unnamed protein product [Effrenium voratum]